MTNTRVHLLAIVATVAFVSSASERGAVTNETRFVFITMRRLRYPTAVQAFVSRNTP